MSYKERDFQFPQDTNPYTQLPDNPWQQSCQDLSTCSSFSAPHCSSASQAIAEPAAKILGAHLASARVKGSPLALRKGAGEGVCAGKDGDRQGINAGSSQDISSGTLPLSDKEISAPAEDLSSPYRIQQLDDFGEEEPPTHSCHLLGSTRQHKVRALPKINTFSTTPYPYPAGVCKRGEIKVFVFCSVFWGFFVSFFNFFFLIFRPDGKTLKN